MNIRTIKNFRIAKSMLNKNITIYVESQGFFYDHDDVFELAVQSDEAEDRVHSVNRSAGYSMTKGYPTWAELGIVNLEKDIINE